MAKVREGQGQLVFGLDIGTRSIVGTVGYLEDDKFHVVAQRSKEHETRAMMDGQIHDIGKVGDTIRQVKEMLENDLECNLTEVCIAAAGRVLRTVTTHVEQAFEEEHEVTSEDVYALSTLGVEQAYDEFLKTNDTDMKFYCVGYTPMRYYMNGYQIGNPEGHKVKHMAMDMIATFLPDDVVDGLYKAVGLSGLHVANLTLEPIAAIQVAIPEKFRMLNMALVDVGAGTSDISITKEGTITAYGMIPVAGDSLTDVLVQHCLVEFDTAEKIKRAAGNQDVIEYQDIMGLPQTITADEVKALLENNVAGMTAQVAECIRELNGDKAVSAVFVVGGGGMIPGYTEKLAEALGIVKERVAIRGQEVMQSIQFEMNNPRRDAMMVTPTGICLSYYMQTNNFIFVDFNGKRVKLYDNGKLSVADVAVQSNLANEDLFPKRGTPLTFVVNGKSRMVRGEQGEAAIIKVNDVEASISTRIHNGDRIEVIPSTSGAVAVLELGQLPELSERLHVYVNGMKIDLPKTATINGRVENEYYKVAEGDEIQVQNFYTVEEIAKFMDVPLGGDILVNDTPAKPETKVYENFTLSWDVNVPLAEERAADTYAELEREAEEAVRQHTEVEARERAEAEARDAEARAKAAAEAKAKIDAHTAQQAQREELRKTYAPQTVQNDVQRSQPVTASVNEVINNVTAEEPAQQEPTKQESTKQEPVQVSMEESGVQPEIPTGPVEVMVVVNNRPVFMSGKSSYVYVDVFSYIDFDLKASAGRAIVTNLNGRAAEYMEPLKNGDVIEIYWKEIR